jgi:hypothetical protein
VGTELFVVWLLLLLLLFIAFLGAVCKRALSNVLSLVIGGLLFDPLGII